MGDPGGHPSQGMHFVFDQQLLLELFGFCHVHGIYENRIFATVFKGDGSRPGPAQVCFEVFFCRLIIFEINLHYGRLLLKDTSVSGFNFGQIVRVNFFKVFKNVFCRR